MNENKAETHPNLPSGEWEGFYLYHNYGDKSKHKMGFTLDFSNGKITGRGSDDIGGFSWKGVYDLENMRVLMVKEYATHPIHYHGIADENGIWGQWSFYGLMVGGGFHIWPKKKGGNEETASEEALERWLEEQLKELEVVEV